MLSAAIQIRVAAQHVNLMISSTLALAGIDPQTELDRVEDLRRVFYEYQDGILVHGYQRWRASFEEGIARFLDEYEQGQHSQDDRAMIIDKHIAFREQYDSFERVMQMD